MPNRKERRMIKALNKKTFERIKKARKEMQAQVGYKGQDFKVVADKDGAEMTIGYTDRPSGGPLVRMAEKHPAMSNVRTVKLTDEEKAALTAPK